MDFMQEKFEAWQAHHSSGETWESPTPNAPTEPDRVPSKNMRKTQCSTIAWTVLLALAAVLFVLYFGTGSFSSRERPDYYKILQLSPSASLNDIRNAYNKLASEYDPVAHPKCQLCPARANRLTDAYWILSDPVTRAQYEDTRPVVKSIESNAVELDADSFEDLVLNSNDYWVLQVYTDPSSRSAKLTPVWEKAVKKLDVDNEKPFHGFVRFGRIHAVDTVEALNFIPGSFRVLPLVVSFYKGRFRRMFDNIRWQSLASVKIELGNDMPNLVQSVRATSGSLRSFSAHTKLDPRPAVLLLSSKPTPSLLCKGMALRYQHVLRIGVMSVDRLGRGTEGRTQLESVFSSAGYPVPGNAVPQILYLSSSNPSWSSASASSFQAEIGHSVANSVLNVTHGGYHAQCGAVSPVRACVLALMHCPTASMSSPSSFPAALDLLRGTQSLWTEGLKKEERKANRVQFGVTWPGLSPLCVSSGRKPNAVVMITDAGRNMLPFAAPVTQGSVVSLMQELLLHETVKPPQVTPKIGMSHGERDNVLYRMLTVWRWLKTTVQHYSTAALKVMSLALFLATCYWACTMCSRQHTVEVLRRVAEKVKPWQKRAATTTQELLKRAATLMVAKTRTWLGQAQSCDSNSPVTEARRLRTACKTGDAEYLLRLGIESSSDVSASIGITGETLLMVASHHGHTLCVRILLRAGADVANRDVTEETALIKAAKCGSLPCLELLMCTGADIDARSQLGTTALMWAATNGHKECVQALASHGADLSVRLKNGNTAMDMAANDTMCSNTRSRSAAKFTSSYALCRRTAELERVKGDAIQHALTANALLEKHVATNAQHQRQLGALQDRRALYANDLRKAQEALAERQRDVDGMKREVQELEQTCNGLREELAMSEQTATKMKAKLDALTSEHRQRRVVLQDRAAQHVKDWVKPHKHDVSTVLDQLHTVFKMDDQQLDSLRTDNARRRLLKAIAIVHPDHRRSEDEWVQLVAEELTKLLNGFKA